MSVAVRAAFAAACFFVFVSAPVASEWSDTDPNINLSHIFSGEINQHGKPVGFHVRLNGKNPEFSRVKEILSGPNRRGVYTAIVEIFDARTNLWKEKFSSFFPSRLTKSQIIDLILTSYEKGKQAGKRKWRAKSAEGFVIEGYTTARGGINTAYPIYVSAQ